MSNAKKMTWVIYRSPEEILVTTLELEHETITSYFDSGARDKDKYTRLVSQNLYALSIKSQVVV